MISFIKAKVEYKKVIGDRFLLKLNKNLNFLPGQFISIVLEKEGKKIIRQYSIASPPNEKIELYVKRVKNGIVSNYLYNLEVGNEITFMGPFGKFNLNNNNKNKDKVFIAVGTGIAPIRSMIKYLLNKKYEGNIYLYYGNRHFYDYFFYDEFKNLSNKYKNFYFYPVLSRPEKDIEWKGYKGYIQDNINLKDFKDKEVYICGSKNAVNINKKLVLNRGCDKNNLFIEGF